MSITSDTTVGALATLHPLATRVFARHGIDYCCGGGQSLSAVCDERGLDLTGVLAEIEAALAERTVEEVHWGERPLSELIDHILVTYHEPLREELPRIEEMVRKVHAVHGDKDRPCFDGLLRTFLAIKADIEQHLPKEEQILFPTIKAGQGAMAMGPMHVMEMEHETLGGMLREVRSLTNDFTLPEGACNTWRALWAALEDLETSLHEHIHLENNVLHPRAREQ
ncbi:MAG: iron-sulfur cluster repair di-iron protein [Planctomycetes bacterium]|jgi:regulator of cell morphogenesis and NO signaling|nr:iron-sulfur cluster repair di-iron protein [Planctomycetota bacterium]MDP6408030.1 iron-sulfur cluster repair di-iron protein [Planctomycetota bacterium]